MLELSTNILSLLIVLSCMFSVLGVMWLLLRHRDATVKLPVDRDMLTRIPAFGLQQEIQDLQIDLLGGMLMGTIAVCIPFAIVAIQAHIVACQKLSGSNKRWKKEYGYHKRSLSETAMFRVKTLLGGWLSLRDYDTQVGEAYAMIKAINKLTGLGMPETYLVV